MACPHRAGVKTIRMVKAKTRLAMNNAPRLGLLRQRNLPLSLKIDAAHFRPVRRMIGPG